MSKIKQIVKEVKVPVGTAAGADEARIELGNEVKKILGYYIIVLSDGGITPKAVKVNFANSGKTVFEPVSLGHLIVGENVAIKDRFFKEDPITVDGYLNAKWITPAPIVGVDLIFHIVMLCETI